MRHFPHAVVLFASFFALAAGGDDEGPMSIVGSPGGIPFELTSNKPFVQVRVNGSAPMWFIVDTGSGRGSVIEREHAEQLGLHLVNDREIHVGAGEGVRVRVASTLGLSLDVGDVAAEGQPALVLPLGHVARYEGRPLDGLIGYHFLRNFVVEIDYAQRRLYLHDPQTFEYMGTGRTIPFTFYRGLVVVDGAVTSPDGESMPGNFVVDTGARCTLVLGRPFVDEHKLLERVPTFAATIGGGVGGESTGRVGRLQSLQLGPFLIPQPMTVFSNDRTGALSRGGFSGIIGGELLRRCRVIFDYSHRQLVLEPYAEPDEAYEYDMSGMFLVAEGKDYRRFKVQSVVDGSAAAEAGIRRGDIVTSVNDAPARELTLERVRDLFKTEGASVKLRIRRGDKTLNARFTLRRLL